MDSSSLSPPSSLSHKWIHDVFPSFRGEDVRRDFLSHIQKEFQRKGITPFIDNEIKRGESIGPELIRAIRGSKIAIILLSRNYASSKWCLEELVEIMNCLNGTQSEHQGDQQGTEQAPTVVPQIVSGPPMIDIDAIEDDDDVVESTASAFAQAKNKSRGARRGPVVVDVDSGGTTRRTRRRSDQTSADSVELNKPRKSKAVAPIEEPKFNCPICMCPFTEEVSTKCGLG